MSARTDKETLAGGVAKAALGSSLGDAADAASQVTLTIDGKELRAQAGETVLDVARRARIYIPALCHIADTAAWGACRLCLVEVDGVDKLQAACTTWVAEGMVVRTNTPRVRARRESYLKMYLSDHNAYCEAPCSHACPTHIDIPAYMALGRRRPRTRPSPSYWPNSLFRASLDGYARLTVSRSVAVAK